MQSLRPIFVSSFFFSVHLALLTYLNSSMLEQYASETLVSVFYTLGSALSLIFVFFAPRIVSKIGLVRFSATLLILSATALTILGLTDIPNIIIPVFIIYASLNALVIYAIDLYIEHYSVESSTGSIRGIYLTLNNVGWVMAPVITGTITSRFGFSMAYIVAACVVVLTVLILLITQRKFKDRIYKTTSVVTAYKAMRNSFVFRRIITINFILQFFFAWMVIYTPFYLINVIGFDWKTVGLLLSIMLIPFAILVYPTGKLVEKVGEKPFIVAGLFIMAFATLMFPFLGKASFIMYAMVLFMTRVGASILEVSTESYFFRRLDDKDMALISIYRNMMPVAYVVAPMLGAVVLITSSYQTLFIILAALLFVGTMYSFRLRK